MIKHILIIPLILIFIGCSAVQENVKKEEKPVYLEAPVEFIDMPIGVALQTVFLRAKNTPFSFDVPDIQKLGTVYLRLNKKEEMDTILKLILEPKGLMFEKDVKGVYHIMKHHPVEPDLIGNSNTKEDIKKKEAHIYIYPQYPPLKFIETPITNVLEMVFLMAGNISFSLV